MHVISVPINICYRVFVRVHVFHIFSQTLTQILQFVSGCNPVKACLRFIAFAAWLLLSALQHPIALVLNLFLNCPNSRVHLRAVKHHLIITWSRKQDLNPWLAVYKTATLPTELFRQRPRRISVEYRDGWGSVITRQGFTYSTHITCLIL